VIKQAYITILFVIKTPLFFHCYFLKFKQYSPPESRLLPVETVPHPTRLESGISKLSFRFLHTTYSYTLRPIHAHSYSNYWFIYLFGSLLPCNFDECKLSLVLNN